MADAINAFWALITLLLTTLTGILAYLAVILRPALAQYIKDRFLRNALGEAMNRVSGVEQGTPVPAGKVSEVVDEAISVATRLNPSRAANLPNIADDLARRITIADPQAKS